MKLMISDSASNPARLAFAQHLFEAGTVGGEGEPAYSATVIIGKQHPSNAALLAAATTSSRRARRCGRPSSIATARRSLRPTA
jgi:hypothetical protein